MTGPAFLQPPDVFLEISTRTLRFLQGDTVREWPLDRSDHGRLTTACQARLRSELSAAVRRQPWQIRPRAWCALGARGLSLRHLQAPTADPARLETVLPLLVESEFPLPPDELAWGYCPLHDSSPTSGAPHHFLLAAIRRDALADLAAVLEASGLNAVFTSAALARNLLNPNASRPCLLLEVDDAESELLRLDAEGPTVLRVLPWGARTLAPTKPPPDGQPTARTLAEALAREGPRYPVIATFAPATHPAADTCLSALRSHASESQTVEALDSAPLPATSAALRGLQAAVRSGRIHALPWLNLRLAAESAAPIRTTLRPWLITATALAVLALALPLVEAALFQPSLARRLTALKKDETRLASIDRQFDFLRHLQQNQAPYLDALIVLAKSVPPGTRFEAVTMNRQGECLVRGSLRNSQQVVDLRTQLVDSGFFASVVTEEAVPTANRQNVNFRIRARWKPRAERRDLPILRVEASTNAASSSTATPPLGPLPTPNPIPPMPPNLSLPTPP